MVAQEDGGEEDDELEPAVEARDAETFDDSEFYQQLLKEFLEGSAVGSGAGALVAAAAGVSDCLRTLPPCHHSSRVSCGVCVPSHGSSVKSRSA